MHRHFNTPQLFKLEILFAGAPDKAAFIEAFENIANRLPLFAEIHQEHAKEQAEVEWNSTLAALISSEIERKQKDSEGVFEKISDSEDSINTSMDSNEESPRNSAPFFSYPPALYASDEDE